MMSRGRQYAGRANDRAHTHTLHRDYALDHVVPVYNHVHYMIERMIGHATETLCPMEAPAPASDNPLIPLPISRFGI